ncbi:MAG: hypothetical protein CMH26_00385 [Micavibrio sp.]|nr:hypothetical protein [Micavibrio sp.]|tara:strand:+ start:734 stop:1651 length:918 start_codon:yes stop_codon:yes gene_type:complete
MKKNAFTIYINANSGTVNNLGKDAIEDLITRSELEIKSLHFLDTEELSKRLEHHDNSEANILIGGGDGTIKLAAEKLIHQEQAFGILPLGTMNLMARDLGIAVELDKAIQSYAQGFNVRHIDVGKVNDDIFLCCTGIGTMPEASVYREHNRNDAQPILIPKMMAYILDQLDKSNHRKLTLKVGSHKKRIKTAALIVSNNIYEAGQNLNEGNFIRHHLDQNLLGIYSARPNTFWDKVRLVFRTSLGQWKDDHSLDQWSSKELEVGFEGQNALISLDGETQEFDKPLKFSILPKSLPVIVPQSAQGS